MPTTTKPPKNFGHVTWDGRLVVDINRLYRSAQTQKTLAEIDKKLPDVCRVKTSPDSQA